MPKLRDFDYAVLDEVRAARRRAPRHRTPPSKAAAAAAAEGSEGSEGGEGTVGGAEARVAAARTAVFRGGLYRLDVYSDRWRQHGVRRTAVNASNWRRVGRTAMIHARQQQQQQQQAGSGGTGGAAASSGTTAAAAELNVHVSLNPAYTRELGLSEEGLEMGAMDRPATLPMEKQQRLFAYVINAEGHGGWADRLVSNGLHPV